MFRTAPGVHCVHWFSKKKWRPDAELAYNFGANILPKLDGRTEHERRYGIYLNMDRVQAWQSLAIAQGVGMVLGSPSKQFFEQLYENEATVNRAVAASKRKGS